MENSCNIDKLLMIGGIFPVQLLPPRHSTSSFSILPKPFGILPSNLLHDRDKTESFVQLLNYEVSLPLNSFLEMYSPWRLGHWVQRFIGRVPEKWFCVRPRVVRKEKLKMTRKWTSKAIIFVRNAISIWIIIVVLRFS